MAKQKTSRMMQTDKPQQVALQATAGEKTVRGRFSGKRKNRPLFLSQEKHIAPTFHNEANALSIKNTCC